jgi:hypothetical protein
VRQRARKKAAVGLLRLKDPSSTCEIVSVSPMRGAFLFARSETVPEGLQRNLLGELVDVVRRRGGTRPTKGWRTWWAA